MYKFCEISTNKVNFAQKKYAKTNENLDDNA
jgi:hypothetical protein